MSKIILRLCAWMLLAAFSNSARAGVLYVKSDATGAHNGSSWVDAYKLLQSALSAAKSGDEIWVAAGTYLPDKGTDRTDPFNMKFGVEIYGGFAGNETMRDQRDWVAHETILKGQSNSRSVVSGFAEPALGGKPAFVLDGFTVTGGNAIENYGAGISLYFVSPTIAHCVIKDNKAFYGGGGMDIAGGAPIITQCTFSGNSVENHPGHGGGAINNRAPSIITSCTFIGNMAPLGAGIETNATGTVITCCTFLNNCVTTGGGTYINECGGGIYTWGSIRISQCTFTGNRATSGGGIYVSSTTTVSQCVFSGNKATGGGGVYTDGLRAAPIITRCAFSDNTADRGGGIYADGAYPNIIGCTFSRNTAAVGGGLHCDSTPTLINCIFWGNQAPTGPEVYRKSGGPIFYYCDIRSSPWDSSWLPSSVGTMQADPLFVDPAHPAGPDGRWMTPDDGLRLTWNSPCIDAGLTSGVPDRDILGRPRNGLADIGAYEYGLPANGVAGWANYR